MRELPPFMLQDAAGRGVSFPSGRRSLVCFVKEDCPTCNEVMPILDAWHRAFGASVELLVVGQTTAGNALLAERHALAVPIFDDSTLKVSFAWDIDTVPTLFVTDSQGQSQRTLVGFVRDEWQALSDELQAIKAPEHAESAAAQALHSLNWSAMPAWRPGCGSLSVDPLIADRLRAEAENSPLRARSFHSCQSTSLKSLLQVGL